MFKYNRKGIILFIVIGVILVVVIFATVVLRIIASQARLTHHQVSRVQAQYAAKAGVIYALDKLRRNDTTAVGCLTSPAGLIMRSSGAAACVLIESALPSSVTQVIINVGPPLGLAQTRKVRARAIYGP